jgi:outer membrane protein assembly factor BamB
VSWKRIGIGVAVGVLALVAAGGVYYVVKQRQAADVRGSSTVEFVPTTPPVVKPKEPGVAWETYGFAPDRLRYAPYRLRPPFRRVWTYRAQALVEFPPVVAFGRLYFAANDGDVIAISARTGKRAWRVPSGRCQASSPAVSGRLVFFTFMNRPPCNRRSPRGIDGRLIAYYAGSGAVRWQKTIGPSESSPVVQDGYVYVADWTGRVWSFVAGSGRLRWVAKVGSQIKGAPTIAGNRLYVGDYSGHLFALKLRTGKLIWRASSQARLGGRGNFYSTPAAAYGRVYVGSTDGKMYSFGATSGKVRWSHGTGGYVYSSPAVWDGRVYFGSYSGRFYCLDAATGDVKWQFDAKGQISGSPTVLDGVVYFATLKQRTFALDARTGKGLWGFADGKYSPVVADAKRLYLVGYARVYGLAEKR